jgi:subtilisin-like proprotein convertase family protein
MQLMYIVKSIYNKYLRIMKKQIQFLLFLAALLLPFMGYNQLTVNSAQTATQLAQILAGPNVVISNATLTGANVASGSFNGTNSNIGMNGGVILSSGDIANAPGPNNTAAASDNLGQAGTAQMDALAGVGTQDAITLEFDFAVQSDFIQFQYIFASEEYPEYAPPNNSAYNDVFAFFISGPGITGQENIALIPGTNNAVTINNINAVTNNQYYIDNAGGATVQYDAFTTILTAERQNLTPCNTYTMKLVISDAGDALYNSAVFLLENSFIQGVVDVNTNTVNADNIALEGCIPASFTVSIDNPSATDTQIIYQIAGLATNGIDYELIDTIVIIPAGQTEVTIVIDAISDGFVEGQESIYLIFQPTLCSSADTAFLYIDDAQPIQFDLQGTNLSCFENSTGIINVNASGGFPPYTYNVTTNAGNGTTTQYGVNPITGLPAGQYSVQVYDIYGCQADALVIGGLYNAGQTFLPDGSGVSYSSALTIAGFDNGETIGNISQVQQICATMEHSYLGDLQIKIIAPSGEEVILKEFNGGGSCDLGEPIATAPVDGAASSNLVDPGVGYQYCWNTSPNFGTMVAESNNYTRNYTDAQGHNYTDNYLPAGAYDAFQNLNLLLGATMNGSWTIEVTDQFNLDNGYIFDWNIALVSDLPDTLVTILEPNEIDINGFITQANCGGADGSINLSVAGDYQPFTYSWSNGAVTEDISGLAAGTYEVFVSDSNGCTDSITFNLNNISSLNISTSTTLVTCAGASNGSIDVTPSGGTPPYTYAWNTGQVTEDLTNVVAGTYTYTLTDANGCVFNEDIVLGTLPPINISLATSVSEFCGQQNGEVNVMVTGGSGSYGYSWDNGAVTQNINGLIAGTYTLTVTDANACTGSNAFTIVNDVSNCSNFCYLSVVTNQITDENCGDGTGAIDVSIANATMPYIVSWSNGNATDDISNVPAGTYSITVTDANQCVVTESIVVGNNSGTLAVASSQINNDNCGNGNGEIDITVTGGSLPYTFSWDNGDATEDISNLIAGIYTVTISDNLGCSMIQSFTVGNNAGTLAESAGTINETCGNQGGIINLSVTGGVAPYTYLWTNGSVNEDLSVLPAGTYSVVITDAVGCQLTSNDYVISNVSGTLVLNNVTVTNEDCANGAGGIDITLVGGTLPYTFAWSNGDATEDITGLTAGLYTGIITDANGCQVQTGNQNVFNTAGDIDVITASLTDEVCGNGTGQIDVTITGGTLPYTLSWDNGDVTEDITGLTAGSYILTIVDANGCTFNYTESVANNPGTLSISSTVGTDENCGDGTGAVNITVAGGNIPYTFVWSNGDATEDITGLTAGTYNLTLTDNAGCVNSTSATISGEGVSITSNVISDEICGDGAGSIDITPLGGATPYTFVWSNGLTTEDLSNLSAGTYSVTITEAGGCTVNESYVVGNNTNGLIIASTVITDENCGDGAGAIDITVAGGTAPLLISWDNGANTEDLTGINGGIYTVTIQDGIGCTVTQSSTVINISGGFTAAITSVTDENCGDGTGAVDITVTGGAMPYTFVWDNGDATEDISGLNAGNYQVTVTENNGCSVVLSTTVNNITGTLAIANVTLQNENCGNAAGFIDLTISGGALPYTFTWDNGAVTEDLSGLIAGTYNCIITDNGGCSINYSATITDAGGGIGTSPVITNELCGNGTGAVDVTVNGGIGPYSYSWSVAAAPTCCDYTLVMTDQGNSWNGGSITVLINSVSIGNFTVPGGGANTETFEVCTGDNVELEWNSGQFDNEVGFDLLDPSGTIIYTHAQGSGPNPGSIYVYTGTCPAPPNNTTGINNLNAGVYNLIITDAVGCTLSENYNVINTPSSLVYTDVTITDDNCNQGNGQINATITGGNVIDYLLDGVSTGLPFPTYFGMSAGTYLITAVDDNGCTVDSIVTVGNQVSFTTTVVSTTDENCGQGNGAIDIDVAGGVNFTYSWDNGISTQDLSNISAGTYTCTITDTDNSCVDQITVSIVNLADITVSSVVTDENCGDGTGAIDLTVVGSNTLTYTWTNGAVTEDLTGLSVGNYECTVLNTSTGCFEVISVDVFNTTTGMTVSGVANDEFCGNSNGDVTLSVNGGSGNYTYVWSNGAVTQNINGLTAGFYTVTVTDVNDGCETTETYEVLSSSSFDVNLISFTNENCGDASGSIDIDVTGGFGSFTYNWSNGGTTEDISGLSAGSYDCTVSNQFGCSQTISVDISNTSDLTILEAFTNENCSDGAGAIDLTVTGSADVSYVWSNGATTEDLTGLSAGTYTCTITNNETSCVSTVNIQILNISTGFTILGGATDEDCGDETGAINITVTGGSGSYSYSWSNGFVTEDLGLLTAGTYTVTVTDNGDGCSISETYTVNNTATFAITAVLTETICAACNVGAIDISITEFLFPDGPYTYSWSNGATTEDISDLLPGFYTVTATSASGCKVTETFEILDNNSVTINENEQLTLSVYPNPAKNNIFVDYGLTNKGNVVLNISTIEGKIVYTNVLNTSNGTIEINTADLSDGIYFVKVQSTGVNKTIKLIIAR